MHVGTLGKVSRHFALRSMLCLRREVREVLRNVQADFGGGCSFSKAFLIAELIRRYDLRTTVDIGVYRGRSLFPQAVAHRSYTHGVVYGIDPWSPLEARQSENLALKRELEAWLEQVDFQAIRQEVATFVDAWHLQDHCVLLAQTSKDAATHFWRNGTYFDLVHIDGNHDSKKVLDDVRLYVPRLRDGGFVILDDVSWESVRPAYEELRITLPLLCVRRDSANDYAVFWKGASRLGAKIRQCLLLWLSGWGKASGTLHG